jgi:hypothetical protein
LREQYLAAEALRCEVEEQRAVVADLLSYSASSVGAVTRSIAVTAAASDTALSTSSSSGQVSSSDAVTDAQLTLTAASAAVVALQSEQGSDALTDLPDALTAAGRISDAPAMCSAVTAVPAAARSGVAASLVPLLGDLASDLMAVAAILLLILRLRTLLIQLLMMLLHCSSSLCHLRCQHHCVLL